MRGLLQEIVRRRLWPIPLVAVLVAVAAPMLFLKSAPSEPAPPAQPSQATIDASAEKGLPVRARRLLETNSAAKRAKKSKAADPFQAPKSSRKASSGAASAGTSTNSAAPSSAAGATGGQKPVPVVITDADGKTKTDTTDGDASSDSTSSGSDGTYVAVDVRFGQKPVGPLRRSIPRLRPFTADGRLVASFVGYSATRNKATFAIAPSTFVAGSVKCRREDGQCRFVDLAVGKRAVLTIAGPGGSAITGWLKVVRMHEVTGDEPKSPLGGSCLLHKLQKSSLGDPAVLSDACE
jgi:hypothetical protein